MNEGGTISAGDLEMPSSKRWLRYLFDNLNEVPEAGKPWDGFPDSPKGTIDVWDEVEV